MSNFPAFLTHILLLYEETVPLFAPSGRAQNPHRPESSEYFMLPGDDGFLGGVSATRSRGLDAKTSEKRTFVRNGREFANMPRHSTLCAYNGPLSIKIAFGAGIDGIIRILSPQRLPFRHSAKISYCVYRIAYCVNGLSAGTIISSKTLESSFVRNTHHGRRNMLLDLPGLCK